MAAPIGTVIIAGFGSTGVPATGVGLLGSVTCTFWNDNTMTFVNTGGSTRTMHLNAEVGDLFKQITTGVNGLSPTKSFDR